MPTVQLYGGRKVDPSLLPGARLEAHETAESEGAGFDLAVAREDEQKGAMFGDAAKAAGDVVGELQKEAKLKEDQAIQVETLDAHSQLSGWKTDALYDPEKGALGVKGQAATPNVGQVLGAFEDQADAIASGLSTDKARAAFARIRQGERDSLHLDLERHAAIEQKQYDSDTVDSFLTNKKNEATVGALDPLTVGRALEQGIGAINAAAPRQGWSPDTTQLKRDQWTTATADSIITRALDNGMTMQAKAYLDHFGPNGLNYITDKDVLAKLEKSMQVGQAKSAGIAAADKIIPTGGTLAEQLAQVKDLPDAERLIAEGRIEHAYGLKQAADRQTSEASLKTAYDILDQTRGNYGAIPSSMIAAMPGAERSALQSYGDRLAKGLPKETNWSVWSARMDEAQNDPATFAKRNLMADRGNLADAQFTQLTELRGSIIKGDREAATRTLAPFTLNNEMVNDALTRYGLDPKAKDGTPQAAANAQLRSLLRDKVTMIESLTGKKVDDVEMRQELDKILSTPATVPGSWWGLVPFTSTHLSDTTKPAVGLTITDVPASVRPALEASLKRHNRPVSDATILDLYIKGLTDKR